MSPRFLQACQSLQSAEKACWEILLRELPEAEVFSAEPLSAAMDHTLAQLWLLLQAGAERQVFSDLARTPPTLPASSECGLTIHLPYFNAGERALELIADEITRADAKRAEPQSQREREELCAAFHVLVQCQLETVCGRCHRAGRCRYGDLRSVAGLPKRTRRENRGATASAKSDERSSGRRGPLPAASAQRRTEGPTD